MFPFPGSKQGFVETQNPKPSAFPPLMYKFSR